MVYSYKKKPLLCFSSVGEVHELEYRIQAKDGTYKWYYDRGKITQYDHKGKPIFLAGIVFDITERKAKEEAIQAENKILFHETITDCLTNLKNRRSILEYLDMKIKISYQKEFPLSIAILDIDDFSRVNNMKGHNVGDKVLIQVANIISKSVRDTDFIGRYGGEEFIVIYPNTKLVHAINCTERIRKHIEEYSFEDGSHITISGGVYHYNGESLEEFINKADKNLNKAKTQGKNKVVF